MNNPWLVSIFGVATLYFGVQALRVLPTLLRLTAALARGAVKWPGPTVRGPDLGTSASIKRLGVRLDGLFPTFLQYTLSLVAALAFFLMSLLDEFLVMVVPLEGNASCVLILTVIAFIAGIIVSRRALQHMGQVNVLLSDLANEAEPREVDGRSAESEYTIQHPLIEYWPPRSDAGKALNLYNEGLAYLRAGDRKRGNILYQEAMNIDPSLHKRACDALRDMAQGCSATDAGSVYYWLGIHSECLGDLQLAATWYEKASMAFEQVDYVKRQGRAHCNLGTVYLELAKHKLGMQQLEKAVALNPSDGIAHFNIGMMYYRISNPGDENHARALDSFAAAIAADPEAYGPVIASRMRSHAYTWKEDLREVLQRAAMKQR